MMFRHQQLFIPSLESLSNYTKGALLYGVFPVCALCETERPGHLNVRGVLRHCVPNRGLRSLAPLCGYPCRPSVMLAVIFYPNLLGGYSKCQNRNPYPNWKRKKPPVNGSLSSSNTRYSSMKTGLPNTAGRFPGGPLSPAVSVRQQLLELHHTIQGHRGL